MESTMSFFQNPLGQFRRGVLPLGGPTSTHKGTPAVGLPASRHPRGEMFETSSIKLSAVIIVPKHRLRSSAFTRARSSVQFADEVMIIETSSPVEDFSAIRNQALSKAKGEWILFVDSDEEVPTGLRNEIARAQSKQYDGYTVKRQEYFLGQWLSHGESSQTRFIRLARSGVGKWIRPVHEQWVINGTVSQLKNPIRHYSSQHVAQFIEKLDWYTTLEARYRTKQNRTGRWWDHAVWFLELFLFPPMKFFQSMVIYAGFRDGMGGFIHALFMSFHSYLLRAKLLTHGR